MLRDIVQGRPDDDTPTLPRQDEKRANPLEPVSSPKGLMRPPPETPPRLVTSPDPSQGLLIKKGHLLGRGAFGSVYLGMNIVTNQLVAIKQIRVSDSQPSVLRAIQRELDVMMRLPPHPNCIHYLGHKENEKHISIIMEFVSGGSVAALFSVGHFHESTVRRYARMALKGLAHLHAHGIIHQDIKAGNVLADSEGVAKIADFGCCKDLQLLTGSVKTAGTPLWMAPEVCAGGAATKSSDMWSFGCFVLEMAKDDHLPWSGMAGGLFAVMYAIGNATRPPPYPDNLSADAVDFLNCCLAIEPSQRKSAEELLSHPWLTNTNDDFTDFTDNLVSLTTTQTTFVNTENTSSTPDGARGGSLKIDNDDTDDSDDGDGVLRVPAVPNVASPVSEDSPHALQTTKPAERIWKTSGQVRVGESDESSDSTLLVKQAEMTPHDSSPSPKGRAKLGQKKSLFQRLFGS